MAAELRISRHMVAKLIRQGDLPAVRIGRCVRIERADVDDYRARIREPGGGAGDITDVDVLFGGDAPALPHDLKQTRSTLDGARW